MKTLTKILAPAGLVLATVAATAPATAQVQGKIATADVPSAIIGSSAFQTAYQQVSTTYSAQIETVRAKQTELSTLLQPFDTNGNSQIEDSELTAVQNSPNVAQIQTLEAEIAAINQQVSSARVYAVEQILAQYPASVREVATAQQIQMVLQPDSVQFAAEGADITQLIITALNTKVPTVGIVPPANYRPSRQGTQILQEIQQFLIRAQIQQQRQQAAQQQQQQGDTQAPQGR